MTEPRSVSSRLRDACAHDGSWWIDLADGPQGSTLDIDILDELSARPGIVSVRGEISALGVEIALSATVVLAATDARLKGGGTKPPLWPGTYRRLQQRLGTGGALSFWASPQGWTAEQALLAGLVEQIPGSAESLVERRRTLLDAWNRFPQSIQSLLALERASGSQASALRRERALFALAFAGDQAQTEARAFVTRPKEKP